MPMPMSTSVSDQRLYPDAQVNPEIVVFRDDPTAAAERNDRGLQQTGQFLNLGRGVLRPATDHDHGVSGRFEEACRLGEDFSGSASI